MKRLVVTADDAGLHSAMTAGALRAHDHGIVTAVSVAPVGEDFAAAAPLLRARPALDVGVHLTLVGGERPLSPAAEVPSLLDRDGRFVADFRRLTWRAVRGRLRADELERELRRQLERVLAAGLEPVHLNSHQHVHVLPEIFEVVLRLADELGIRWVRMPAEPRPGGARVRAAQLRVLGRLTRAARRRLEREAPRTLGIREAGGLTRERLRRALRDAAQTNELVCHPGADDLVLSRRYSWGYRWQRETETLCDPAARADLAAAGLTLCGFRGLS